MLCIGLERWLRFPPSLPRWFNLLVSTDKYSRPIPKTAEKANHNHLPRPEPLGPVSVGYTSLSLRSPQTDGSLNCWEFYVMDYDYTASHFTGFPGGRFRGVPPKLATPPPKKKQKFFIKRLTALAVSTPPANSTNSPPKHKILQETLLHLRPCYTYAPATPTPTLRLLLDSCTRRSSTEAIRPDNWIFSEL